MMFSTAALLLGILRFGINILKVNMFLTIRKKKTITTDQIWSRPK